MWFRADIFPHDRRVSFFHWNQLLNSEFKFFRVIEKSKKFFSDIGPIPAHEGKLDYKTAAKATDRFCLKSMFMNKLHNIQTKFIEFPQLINFNHAEDGSGIHLFCQNPIIQG